MTLQYPIAIEPGDSKHAFGVVVPDLPGCFSAGDTLDQAIANSREAIALWLEETARQGNAPPKPKAVDAHRKNVSFKGWLWAIVEVNIGRAAGKAERINITLPRRLLARVDARAQKNGESRSGFLARAALQALAHEQQ